jgi:HEAT repeats/Prenyltransferase and squalene oxidase repeat
VLYQLSYLSGSVHDRENRATVNGRDATMICDLRGHLRPKTATGLVLSSICVALLLASAWHGESRAGETPDSPNVKKVVDSALKFLEGRSDERLGGKCLMALAFLKAGKLDHPKVREAIEECAKVEKANLDETALDNYSNGLAIIFLCEVSAAKHSRTIQYYLDRLKARQKKQGGWGYKEANTGDTSQTQYAALSYWEAHRFGFKVDAGSVERLADWLIRTQAPNGSWGYQGQVAPGDEPIPQDEETCSLLAAGLGSTYICADLFGLRPGGVYEADDEQVKSEIPIALRKVVAATPAREQHSLRLQKLSPSKIFRAVGHAHSWMAKNYKIDIGSKCYYYLYGLERYKSFQESMEGLQDISPGWYNDGYEFLAKSQAPDGSWVGYCGHECDTAFSVLFLLRSTQKSIKAKLGEGMLLSGRGLPSNLARAKLRDGQLIAEQVHKNVDELLSMVDDKNEGTLDELARDPTQLVVEHVDEKSARRLLQLIRSGSPQVRVLATRAIGRTGNMDYVPTLLYALTDPDTRVVIEARNGLRFISRNFDGLGPPDEFTEQQRFEAIDNWKRWYKSIRPTAVLEK